MTELKNQTCPICGKSKCTLNEDEVNIPKLGNIFVFSICCENCGFSKSDVEFEEKKDPIKITFEVNSKKDMDVKVMRSSNGLVKVPQIKMSIESGEGSDGFISTIEGLINKFEKVLEAERDSAEDKKDRKKAKNTLKKLWKVKLGEQPLKIIIEDKSGNSAIVSDKAKVEKLKK